MLSSTALSPYHYNTLLDTRSQQPIIGNVAFYASSIKYGGCTVNAQAGIDGRARLQSKGRKFSDGGLASCPSKGTVTYVPDEHTSTKGPVMVTITTHKPLLSGLDDRTFLGNNQYQKLYTHNKDDILLVTDADGEGKIEVHVVQIDRNNFSGSQGAFVSTWTTLFPGDKIFIPTSGAGYDFEIDRGDGNIETYTGKPGILQHTYTTPGNHQVRIKGTFPRIYLYGTKDLVYNNAKLRRIDQWGNIAWTNMESAFYGATNLNITATDTPHLSQVTNMSGMFYGATNLTGNFSGWDTSKVTNMYMMFREATNFNQDISNWDTSKVTNM
jgi:surface protein